MKNDQLDFKNHPALKKGVRFDYDILDIHDIEDGAQPGRYIEFRLGGFGSAISPHPVHCHQFYALTDRGPNTDYDVHQDHGKKFLDPSYTPRIGLFEISANGSIKKVQEILLKTPQGKRITGLPNPHFGATRETAYDRYGQKLEPGTDEFGLDTEGLVAMQDGTFWVSDEYGPHLVHFDVQGLEIDRINAYEADQRRKSGYLLPLEYANRRQNRGMEGLTITLDQTTLVGIMQSAMSNPDASSNQSTLTRIVMINLHTKKVEQYLYRQDSSEKVHSNTCITALSQTEFLVAERDDDFYKDNKNAFKRVFKIDTEQATNLEDIQDDGLFKQDENLGLLIGGLTLEQYVLKHGWEDLERLGMHAVTKELVVDLIEKLQYPHDKVEGLWVIDATHLAVLNDDDYAFSENDDVIQQKYLDQEHKIIDANTLYILDGLELRHK